MNAIVKLASFFCKDIPKDFDQLNLWQKLWLIFPVAALFSSLVFLIAVIVFAHDFGIFNGESLLFLISALLVLPIPSIIYRIGRVIGNWMALRKSKRNHQRQLYTEEENKAYAKIGEEIDAGIIDKGLWTKCFADAGGNSNEQKALYLKIKAKQLMRNN